MVRYEIQHEDDWIIVINKSAGLLVIPTPRREHNTLTHLINRHLAEKGLQVNAYPCHRIDKETSGLIIYAKGKKVQRLMMDEFKRRKVKKTYVAFIQGHLKRTSGTIRGYIYDKHNRKTFAVTKYRLLERRPGFSVVEAQPITGRTNQLRIQFKQLGHPLLGERVYAFRKDFKIKFKRLALHAKEIEFRHPITSKRCHFSMNLPKDMGTFLSGVNICQQISYS